MGFYDLTKAERVKLVAHINKSILSDIRDKKQRNIAGYFSDEDTYIRKTAYLSIGKIYKEHDHLRNHILEFLHKLIESEDFKIRQTTINAAGEIGIKDFNSVEHFFDAGLFDQHHSVRNAVIGSIKKMGERNPKPVLKWSKKYLHHPDKEVRREICHGIELRGRTHPQEILPLLQELENDDTTRVRNTLIHVIGQISYKKGCLETVVQHLNYWKNKALVAEAMEEIIDVHDRYKNFSVLNQQQAIDYLSKHLKK